MATTDIDITPGNSGGPTSNCVTVDMGCCASGFSLGTATAPSGCSFATSQYLGGRNATDNYQTPYTDGNGTEYDSAYQICFDCDSTAQSGSGSVSYDCTEDTSADTCSSNAAGDPHIRMFDGEQYML